jgi:hypothetical protein
MEMPLHFIVTKKKYCMKTVTPEAIAKSRNYPDFVSFWMIARTNSYSNYYRHWYNAYHKHVELWIYSGYVTCSYPNMDTIFVFVEDWILDANI